MRCGAKFNLVPGLNTIKSLGMTMQELAYKGWLEGPTPEMSWMFLLARRWLHVRRFAVWQRSK